ncbi:MAG: 30S ribosomal protein S18 [Chloroflexi bacterium]|nr:30S ribosomal protein S18 [Chloroflexota bacterium]
MVVAPSRASAPRSGRPLGGDRGGPGRRGRGRRFFAGRRRVCSFCMDHVKGIDYKDVVRLRRFISERARIEPRRKVGTCAKHQRMLSTAIKRARHLALLPTTGEHLRQFRAGVESERNVPVPHVPAPQT